MKKQLIAKLIVLSMIAAMLPMTAVAVGESGNVRENGPYYSIDDDTNTDYDDDDDDDDDRGSSTVAPKPPVAPVETVTEPTVVETIPTVNTTTNANGQTVASAAVRAEVSDEGTATVELSKAAVADLASKAAGADVVVLNVNAKNATKAVVAVPATALTSLKAETGADLTVASAVAEITVSNEILAALPASAKNVEITAEKNSDGTIAVALIVDGRAADLSAGLPVSIPVEHEADSISAIYLVLDNGTEVEITDWEIAEDGSLKLTITANGSIRIDTK